MDVENVANGYLAGFRGFPKKARIETQIHRRRAAKPLSALVLEWEQAKPTTSDERADQEQLLSDQSIP
ncbi:MAG TPA: hypothetical protein PKD12_13275 [Nitrospira sp.]|nr:hypothetical protein [Nitrospira sp.]